MHGQSPASPEGGRYPSRVGGGVVALGQTGERHLDFVLHCAPRAKFFSGAMADVLKADDNQTGTAALGSSREPLF